MESMGSDDIISPPSAPDARVSQATSHDPEEDTMEDRVMEILRRQGVSTMSGVDEALGQVRAAAGRPKFSFDAYYLIGLLEHLEETSRHTDHPKAKFYAAVLKKVRAHMHNPSVGELCLQLVGSAEDHLVANAEARWLKTKGGAYGSDTSSDYNPGYASRGGHPGSRGRGRGRGGSMGVKRCFQCNEVGHFQRECPKGQKH